MKKLMTALMASILLAGGAFMADEAAPETEAKKPAAVKDEPKFKRPDRPDRPGASFFNSEKRMEQLNKDGKEILEMYDADKDGKLSEAERAKMDADFKLAAKLQKYLRSKDLLDAADKDKDMQISKSEGKDLPKALREYMKSHAKDLRDRRFPGNNARRPPAKPADKKTPAAEAPAPEK